MLFQADRLLDDSTFTHTWFDPFVTREHVEGDRMSYTCDEQLGSPNAVDCEHVLYSQLGYPNDILTLSPESGKIMSSSKW